jgi:hypothetical protein
MDQHPSLGRQLPEMLRRAYGEARSKAAEQTRLDVAQFPNTCPYGLEQMLDVEFLPK